MRLHWIALSGVLIACGTGPGSGAAGGPLGEDPGNTGVGDEDPGATGVGDEDPGGSGGPGQGGSGNTGGGDGGTGNIGQGGSGNGGTGGGSLDCVTECQNCQGGEICSGLCAEASPSQLECAAAALPNCSEALTCLTGGGGTGGGGTGGVGTGGGSGACAYPDCGGCVGLCDQCLCVYQGDTEFCASSCG
jgi:hypothetical protein